MIPIAILAYGFLEGSSRAKWIGGLWLALDAALILSKKNTGVLATTWLG